MSINRHLLRDSLPLLRKQFPYRIHHFPFHVQIYLDRFVRFHHKRGLCFQGFVSATRASRLQKGNIDRFFQDSRLWIWRIACLSLRRNSEIPSSYGRFKRGTASSNSIRAIERIRARMDVDFAVISEERKRRKGAIACVIAHDTLKRVARLIVVRKEGGWNS